MLVSVWCGKSMMESDAMTRKWHGIPCALILGVTIPAQMEKRDLDRFQRRAFELQSPALGTTVLEDLCLEHTDGRPWSLAQQLGKTLVLVKAGFT